MKAPSIPKNLNGWIVLKDQKAFERWKKRTKFEYSARRRGFGFPCLARVYDVEGGLIRVADTITLDEAVQMGRMLTHAADVAALRATKPELFAQIKNIIFKGADPDCKQCNGTGRYRLPPAFPRFHEAWGDCPCVTTVAKSTTGNVETTFIEQGFAVCIEDRAIHILKTKGEMRAGDLGWELWCETTESARRGTGSHRSNKFCRPAGKLLKRLEKDNRVTHFAKPGGIYWRAL